MYKRKAMAFLLCATVSTSLWAQKRQIIGKIQSASTHFPLNGVSVMLKDGKTHASTSDNGNFSLRAEIGDSIFLSHIGYKSLRTVIGSDSLHFDLEEENKALTEVVVTALGIKKQKASLGYSVTEVKGDELTQARESNFMNSLSGKVAGLNITAGAGGPGSSNNVLIRGQSSIDGTSQPLYVINGVPMENGRKYQSGGQWDNGPDLGDALSNLNPDDIESVSVLKGAAASALYGYRAKAGVIMITTKTAKSNSIELNSNFVGQKVYNLTDWQYVYGQGTNNLKPTDGSSAAQGGGSSWGAKLDGSMVPQFDGVKRPYSAVKNNINNFYRTGATSTNTLTLNKVFTGGSIRLSGANMHDASIIPNSNLNRNTFTLAGIFDPMKNLKIDVRVNYIMDKAKNRAMLSDGAGNGNYQIMFLPTSLDANTLKPGFNPDGSELTFNSGNVWATNPWFQVKKFINDTKRERLLSSVTARYDWKGYYIQGRVSRDHYNDSYLSVVPTGTAYRPKGSMSQVNTEYNETNVDGMIGKTFEISDFSLSPMFGAAYRRQSTVAYTLNGTDFNVPFVYNILNTANNGITYTDDNSETQSLYGNMEVDYKNFLYVTGSVRSDWFSSLATPSKNNKLNIVYPGVNASFVFTELWKPSFIDYGKLRTGYAKVGNATDPYQTSLTYNFMGQTVNGNPLGTIYNSAIPNSSLFASSATELEVGLELNMLRNLISIDFAWYNKKSKDEIVPISISNTTGYSGAMLNSGKMQNRGVEGLLTMRILRNKTGLSWTTSLNGSINNNKIITMAEGTSVYPMGTSRTGAAFLQHITGLPAFQIMAYDYEYNNDGSIAKDASGIPQRGILKPMGTAIPKYNAGWNNEFNFKGINLSFLIEGKWGAKIYSGTDYYAYVNGLHKGTLVNREGDFAPQGSNTPTQAQTYYANLVQNVSKINVQNADFIKLRQIILGYTFRAPFKGSFQSIGISAVARNPFILMRKTDNIDPEGGYSSWAPGLELGGVPPMRSYGINLNVKF